MVASKDRKRRAPVKRRWRRRLAITAAVGLVVLLGLWYGVNHTSWLGPALADGLRAVLGPKAVAWLEDVAYDLQDRVDRWRYRSAQPKTFWSLPSGLPRPSASGEADPPADVFSPAPFEPPYRDVATAADGLWIPIVDADEPKAPVRMYKTIVHPDQRRSFAALAVVAVDAGSLELHLVAGTTEPRSDHVVLRDRPGVIPATDRESLVAAFNGGFKATHGQYGMMLDRVVYLPPRDFACTLVRYQDGGMTVGTWSGLSRDVERIRYYRQGPPCLVEAGKVHQALLYQEYAKGWGATVGGDTVIRRSAVGMARDGKTLFYGLGDALTAQSLARGMQAAGAQAAVELDVNYSYPRFLFYQRVAAGEGPVATAALIPGIQFTKDEYVTRASPRDFFYLTRERRTLGPSGRHAPRREGRLAAR